MVKNLLTILFRIFIALLLLFGGVQHFINMEYYLPFLPTFLAYKPFVIYSSGIIEILLGISLLIPKTKQLASWVCVILMCLILPIHIVDLYTETIIMGTHQAAIIRLIVQLLLIALAVCFVGYSQTLTFEGNEN